ncbi:MAG TPA: histidine kinase dimerization/phosphoacceptor domain -containing protein [Rhodoblastus sp.]|nr:histidine kinase dimerization/phosphoacceptor domain -containing protein [Rhodoblastus sp.]
MPFGSDILGPIVVLYVEDDAALATLVGKALRRRGHSMAHVTNSADALSRIAEGGIDVVALDHTLPGETGLDMLDRVGPRGGRPPIVYVTGSMDARLAVEALKRGADDYVIKDLSVEFYDLLIAALEQALERARLKRMRAESDRAVREARDRAEALLSEVNHRIANSLALVGSMVRMQSSMIRDPAARHALQETQNRIAAVAGVHRHLYTSAQTNMVEISDYLGHLVQELAASMRGVHAGVWVETAFEPGAIKTDKAVALGVMVSELVTNAFKYAYPSEAGGPVRVSSTMTPDGMARVVVEDDGVGCAADGEAKGTGLGTKILKAMSRTLNAQLDYEPVAQGMRAVIVFAPVSTKEKSAEAASARRNESVGR